MNIRRNARLEYFGSFKRAHAPARAFFASSTENTLASVEGLPALASRFSSNGRSCGKIGTAKPERVFCRNVRSCPRSRFTFAQVNPDVSACPSPASPRNSIKSALSSAVSAYFCSRMLVTIARNSSRLGVRADWLLTPPLLHACNWRPRNHAIRFNHGEHGANGFKGLVVSGDTVIKRQKLCGLAWLYPADESTSAARPTLANPVEQSDLVGDRIPSKMLNCLLELFGELLERDLYRLEVESFKVTFSFRRAVVRSFVLSVCFISLPRSLTRAK
jgi:hypothetical protein